MRRAEAMLAAVVLAAWTACDGGSAEGGEAHTLVLHVNGNGTTDPAPGVHRVAHGRTVTVTATPRSGGTFAGWSVGATGTAQTVELLMNGDQTLVASFTGGEGFGWTTPVTTYDNPVLPGDHPDQNVFVEGDTFYLTGSSFGMSPYVEIQRSTDLLHWERVSRVVSPEWATLQSTIAGGGTWGAFIVKPGPTLYRVYFAVDFGQYFSEAASLEGPWSTPTQVSAFPYTPPGASVSFQRGNGYDDSVFVDDDGTAYLLVKASQCSWNGLSGGQENNFGINQLVKIDPVTGQLVAAGAIDLSWMNGAVDNGGCGAGENTENWAEGPTMTKKDGFYYYFVSTHTGCGGTEFGWRSATLSSDPDDWTPLGEVLAGEPPFTGAQHSTAPFELADGTWWAFSHSYECNGWEGLARQSLLSRVTWVPDGPGERPVFDGAWSARPAPRLPPSGAPFLLPFHDDFDGAALRTGWTFLGAMPADRTSLADRPGWLRVKPAAGRTVHVVQKDALHAHAMVTRLDFQPAGAADVAGLRLGNALPAEQAGVMPAWANARSLELSLVRIRTSSGDQVRFALAPFALGAAPAPAFSYLAPAPPGAVWLKIERADHRATGWYSADGVAWTQVGNAFDVSALDGESTLGDAWVGTQAGVFASNAAADFDFFTYRDGFSPTLARESDQQGGTSLVDGGAQGPVRSLSQGDWALYGSLDLGSAGVRAGAIELTVASAGAGGALEVWIDPLAGGTRLATCAVASTGGWDAWRTVTCPLAASGTHEVYLRAAGGAGELVRLARFRFVPAR